jgi:hypothetical protein
MTNNVLSVRFSCKNLVSIILTGILLHFNLSSHAAESGVQDLDVRISLNVKEMPVTEVLKKINSKVKNPKK